MKEIKKFELTNYYDILNLYKALLEAKFSENPNNFNIAGSPVIARFINELVDSLSDYKDNEDDENKRWKTSWKEWRKLKNRNDYREKVINFIVKFQVSDWLKYNIEEKKERLPNYLSPFTCTEEELIETINEIDFTIEKLKNENYYRKEAINFIVKSDFSDWIELTMQEKKYSLPSYLSLLNYTEEEIIQIIN